MRILAAAACLAQFVQQASSSPALEAIEEKRAACNQDNLLRALQSPTRLADSYKFCSQYLSIPPTSTVTVYTATCVLSSYDTDFTVIHPLALYNLQPVFTSPQPLSYNSASPTPIKIPGDPQSYVGPGNKKYRAKRDECSDGVKEPIPPPKQTPAPTPAPTFPPTPPQELLRRADPPLPSYIATTYPPSRLSSACSCLSVPAAHTTTESDSSFSIDVTTTCTGYKPTTVATYAAICAPSLQANAPVPLSKPGFRVVASFAVASKMDCCAACTSVFNCVWWKFDFGTRGDGWKPGTCHYAYNIRNYGFTDSEIPAVCPNGVAQALDRSKYPGKIGREANNNEPGYNYGPCGGAFNLYESAQDAGYPDDYNDHYCGQPGQQPVYGPGC